jgi:hypothetical protein
LATMGGAGSVLKDLNWRGARLASNIWMSLLWQKQLVLTLLETGEELVLLLIYSFIEMSASYDAKHGK